MNLILLFPEDFIDGSKRVVLSGRRHEHIKNIIKPTLGKVLTVGIVNGLAGQGIVTKLSNSILEMDVSLNTAPPVPNLITLILAMPRPLVLNRMLSSISSMGIKNIILLNTWRVEKSFWNSPVLKKENIREQLILGLEQAKDTKLPEVTLERYFKTFVKDKLTNIIRNKECFIAHPDSPKSLGKVSKKEIVLAIGPEGGFLDKEVEAFAEIGFKPVNVGDRILRVETAVPFIIGRLSK